MENFEWQDIQLFLQMGWEKIVQPILPCCNYLFIEGIYKKEGPYILLSLIFTFVIIAIHFNIQQVQSSQQQVPQKLTNLKSKLFEIVSAQGMKLIFLQLAVLSLTTQCIQLIIVFLLLQLALIFFLPPRQQINTYILMMTCFLLYIIYFVIIYSFKIGLVLFVQVPISIAIKGYIEMNIHRRKIDKQSFIRQMKARLKESFQKHQQKDKDQIEKQNIYLMLVFGLLMTMFIGFCMYSGTDQKQLEIYAFLYIVFTCLYFWLKYYHVYDCNVQGQTQTIIQVSMVVALFFTFKDLLTLKWAVQITPLLLIMVIKLIVPNYWGYYYSKESNKAKQRFENEENGEQKAIKQKQWVNKRHQQQQYAREKKQLKSDIMSAFILTLVQGSIFFFDYLDGTKVIFASIFSFSVTISAMSYHIQTLKHYPFLNHKFEIMRFVISFASCYLMYQYVL